MATRSYASHNSFSIVSSEVSFVSNWWYTKFVRRSSRIDWHHIRHQRKKLQANIFSKNTKNNLLIAGRNGPETGVHWIKISGAGRSSSESMKPRPFTTRLLTGWCELGHYPVETSKKNRQMIPSPRIEKISIKLLLEGFRIDFDVRRHTHDGNQNHQPERFLDQKELCNSA